MSGTFFAPSRSIVRLLIGNNKGQIEWIDAELDTGFSGFLTLPLEVIQRLGFPKVGEESVTLADGSKIKVDVHGGLVVWEGNPKLVPIQANPSESLLGVGLLMGHDLSIRFQDGGEVRIEPIP